MWRSLEEQADSPRFRETAGKEFVGYRPGQMIDSPTRRSVIKLMGASVALAGGALAGCRRWPEKEVAPHTSRPEGRVPGTTEKYATVFELNGVAQGLLVSCIDGRPIKVEGNPGHPESRGAATTLAQASILDLYDPARATAVTRPKEKQSGSSWKEFEAAIGAIDLGDGFAILSEATSSPTQWRILAAMNPKPAFVGAWSPINHDNEREGTKIAFGKAMRPQLHLDKADVIVSLDADILGGTHPASLKHAKDFANARRGMDSGKMNRLYVAESTLSITGTNADRRLAIQSSRIGLIVSALSDFFGVTKTGHAGLMAQEQSFVSDMINDLNASGESVGRTLICTGPSQPPAVHATVALLNEKLANSGQTVTYTDAGDAPSCVDSLKQLVESMNAGKIKTLLIIGGNPAYDAPADLKFAEALTKVSTTIHLSTHTNETSAACDWHLPRSHYMEHWGDARAWDGTVSVTQPLILPLYDTRSPIELLATLGGVRATGYNLVRQTFGSWIGADAFERGWRKVLRDGFMEGSAAPAQSPNPSRDGDPVSLTTAPEWELTFTSDYSVFDGRFSHHGWMQELPDPITKIVWDNAAMVSLADAAKLGVKHGDMIRLQVGAATLDLPVYQLPGQANGSIAVSLGYGRTRSGYIADGVGFDAYTVRRSDAMHAAAIETPKKLNRTAKLVTTQDHYAIDQIGMTERQQRVDRWLLRTAPVDYYAHNPTFAQQMEIHTPMRANETGRIVPLQIFDEPAGIQLQNVHRWGMAIDLASCIGCNACVVACQAENNIPIVGKEEVSRNREMHWIRIDRYFTAAKDGKRIDRPGEANLAEEGVTFQALHQPLTCHHCETAPCEQVCPVAATVHDSEGLNVMIYNRCVGTRYCSNNCPYKVRRFNYFDWQSKPVKGAPWTGTYIGFPDQQQEEKVPPVRRMGFNPQVTVRMRGVMEKCTFCTQRIKAATIPALSDFRAGKRPSPRVEDGAITPACAQTCPTDAIVFGDLADPNSRVAKLAAHQRAYTMLNEVNTRPRTSYLARITNPGPGKGLDPIVPRHGGGHPTPEPHGAEHHG